WAWNEADGTRRYILGGGWNEPSYTFYAPDAQQPLARKPSYGVRCARNPTPLPADQTGRIAAPLRDWRQETPADDEVFAIYRSLYEYDRTPLDPSTDSVQKEFDDWTVEHVSIAAAYGNERIPARLFLPKTGRAPYQTVVYYSGGPFLQSTPPGVVDGEAYWFLFLIRSGRAVLFPIYKGSYDRYSGSIFLPHIWRDVIIQSAKDLRRGVDYLETRPDIDAQRLAYFGLSMGGGVGPIMTAVEPRFKASVLLGGGLYLWDLPAESNAFHFLPRVKVPTLMINGRHDFFYPYENSQRPMFERLGLPPDDKRHVVFESGHIPGERNEVIKEVLDWLDRYLGPVRRPPLSGE
ncbi:MAG: hypothetical protein R3224_08125, partial [Balneolaceae bacterium]|nr:hypothetical protein [Balneolaceae bacterium]